LDVTDSLKRKQLLGGVLFGAMMMLLGRQVIDNTPFVDWFIAPLVEADTNGPADAIVVLGAGVTELCTPNLNGIQRTLLGAEQFHIGRAPVMLFTGGGVGQDCTIADAMAALAERLGVPRQRIRTETRSESTWQNAERTDALLRTMGVGRILLVTDRPHMRRADATFRRYGYRVERAGVPVPLGHSSNTHLLAMGLREYAATAYYWLLGYTSDAPAPRSLVAPIADHARDARVNLGPHATMDVESVRRNPDGPVVILGASYARSWQPAVDGLTFVNLGIAGEQSFEMRNRFAAAVLRHEPRAVILWGFINDVFRSPRDRIATTLARTRDSYVAMVQLARQAGIEPVLATEVTAGQKAGVKEAVAGIFGRLLAKQGYHDYVNRHVMDTNTWLRELAHQEGVLLLDFEQVFSTEGSGERRHEYTAADGSHITNAGYLALSAYAGPILHSRVGSRP
jgi:uncharacterized SAM-binding protein YcdF (DUF218 family)/lysophospholipase L1-like esterase